MALANDNSNGTQPTSGQFGLLLVFGITIFLSAALLFAVQPIFTKMVLPRLGGSASVWSVAMVFFQAVLLAGYAYAHLATRYLGGTLSVVVHLIVMGVATLVLPLSIAVGWGQPPTSGEALWLIGLFSVSIGLPFFALSGNGPLIQAWFARTEHPSAKDPYFLYAASNVGSFLALLAYPFLIEPFSRLGQQTAAWSFGFYLLIVLLALCGILLWFSGRAGTFIAHIESPDLSPPTWRDAAIWVGLAAVPSGLLIAVTAHLSTDVAPAPFLWVIPLALYLATFVIVFQKKPLISHRVALFVQPFLLIGLAITIIFEFTDYQMIVLVLHTIAFFFNALVCHGELARRRPEARHLTAFYMWMSLGGVIGGIFSGLIAPNVFSWVLEYPLLIVLAILCRPGIAWPRGATALTLELVAAAAVVVIVGTSLDYEVNTNIYNGVIGGLLMLALLVSRDPLKFAPVLALCFLIFKLYEPDVGARQTVRSFFGVHKIVEYEGGADGEGFRVLMHGTTIHGAERMHDIESEEAAAETPPPPTKPTESADTTPATPAAPPSEQPATSPPAAPSDTATKPETPPAVAATPAKPEPLTYYHAGSAMTQTIAAVRARVNGPIRIGVVGLGTGTLACYFQPGDTWRYYEIDPTVVRITRDLKRFTFLSRCAPDIPIVLGDARLTLADAPDASYDLIIVDAFSSDTIPVHLMTREAMAIYAKKIAPHGLIVLHVSNRYMELASVVAGIANANGLLARTNSAESETGTDDDEYKFESTVVASAREEADFGKLTSDYKWVEPDVDPEQRVWTDDYSNIIGAILRQWK